MNRLRVVAVVIFASLGRIAEARAATGAPSPSPQVHRILHVCDCLPERAREERDALLRAFTKDGYVQGRNLDLATYDFEAVAAQFTPGGPLFMLDKRVSNPYAAFLAREIARNRAHLVLASGMRVAQGASEGAKETPVVFWRVSDPVALGFVDSLAHPGRNLTGFSRAIERLTVKRLELLHEMLPQARRIGFMYVADLQHHRRQFGEVSAAGERLGLEIVDLPVPMVDWSGERLEQSFAALRRAGVEALLLPDTNVQLQLVVALAAKYRMPSIHSLTHTVTEWGGLAAYTTSEREELPGVARYAARILRGERAGDLPVQEPSQYELVLNSRAARAIGVRFPRTFMLRATQVIDK